MLPLAEIDNASVGLLIQGLTALVMLALLASQWVRGQTGKDGERQIEPTALHAITNELRGQTATLNKLDREVGEVRTSVGSLEKNMDGLHIRMGGVSRELSATTARVDGLEKRESHG